ncbi:hypothetical protein DFP92_13213, partial [Yoonia sediminilitoris]
MRRAYAQVCVFPSLMKRSLVRLAVIYAKRSERPVWMYMDPALLQQSWQAWFRITIADVYPASLSGPI